MWFRLITEQHVLLLATQTRPTFPKLCWKMVLLLMIPKRSLVVVEISPLKSSMGFMVPTTVARAPVFMVHTNCMILDRVDRIDLIQSPASQSRPPRYAEVMKFTDMYPLSIHEGEEENECVYICHHGPSNTAFMKTGSHISTPRSSEFGGPLRDDAVMKFTDVYPLSIHADKDEVCLPLWSLGYRSYENWIYTSRLMWDYM